MPLDELNPNQVIALGESLAELSIHPGWQAYQQYMHDQIIAVGEAALSGEGPAELNAEQKITYWRGYRAAIDDLRKAPGRIVADAERVKRGKTGEKR